MSFGADRPVDKIILVILFRIIMANTYTQIHLHLVFAVQNREGLIRKEWKEELYRYITGIIKNHGHKVLAINGMPDHVHILIGMRPTQSLSDLMQDIKGDSSKWINLKEFIKSRFSWQSGYGAFSIDKSRVNAVIEYIKNQELHHRMKSFKNEYLDLLKEFGVEFDISFVIHAIEEV